MKYYAEVVDRQPKNCIEFCFKCRIIELQLEGTSKFHDLDDAHPDLFQAYLAGDKSVPESVVRDILKNGGFDFKLKTPTYLVHEYTEDAFSCDIINGFASGRYSGDSRFAIIRGGDVYYNHSLSGCHMVGDIRLHNFQDFSGHANDLFKCIDLEKYGEDLLECACTYSNGYSRGLRISILNSGIKLPIDTLYKLAATNIDLFLDVYEACVVSYSVKISDLSKRNKDVAKNSHHIHPDHKDIGLNLVDVMVLLNPSPKISISKFSPKKKFSSKPQLTRQDLKILVKSLKYWLEHVNNEREYELIQKRIKYLEDRDHKINLFR